MRCYLKSKRRLIILKTYHIIKIHIIITLLLISQQGLFVHAAEHSFHQADNICDIFISMEQSEDAIIPVNSTYIATKNRVLPTHSNVSCVTFKKLSQPARGPPLL